MSVFIGRPDPASVAGLDGRASQGKPLSPRLRADRCFTILPNIRTKEPLNHSGHLNLVQIHDSTCSGSPCRHCDTPPGLPFT